MKGLRTIALNFKGSAFVHIGSKQRLCPKITCWICLDSHTRQAHKSPSAVQVAHTLLLITAAPYTESPIHPYLKPTSQQILPIYSEPLNLGYLYFYSKLLNNRSIVRSNVIIESYAIVEYLIIFRATRAKFQPEPSIDNNQEPTRSALITPSINTEI